MKPFLLFFMLCLLTIDLSACSCFGEGSFCNYVNNEFNDFGKNGLICIAAPTGNYTYDYSESYYEMKITEPIFGEIKPGDENHENTDSTFWLVLGAGATCYDEGFYGNTEDQFVIASVFGSHFLGGKTVEGYSLFLCVNDAFKYEEVMYGPIINDALFTNEQFIWNIDTVEADNIISTITDCSNFLINDVEDYSNVQKQFDVYPNPAVNSIHLNFESAFTFNQPLLLELVGLHGKVEHKQKLGSYNNEIDISQLATGMYFLSIESNNQVFSKKIIVEK